jgi:hypothetical protein
MTIDELYQTSQSYINTPGLPLVVLGSGASMAYGLPGMWELAQELKTITITDKQDQPCWKQFLSLIDSLDLESVLLKVTLTENALNKVIQKTWQFINGRDLQMFNSTVIKNDEFPLANLFKHFLTSSSKSLHIITTNYDRLAEYAASSINLYPYTFFNAGHIGEFIGEQDDCFTRAKGCSGVASICKLHGSLDWFSINTSYLKYKSIPLQQVIPLNATPCIITPGIEKFRRTTQTPFRELFQISDDQIRKASAFLCIGYGFNDEHVHPKILDSITKNKKPLVVIARKLTPKTREIISLPNADKILLIEEGDNGNSFVYTKKYQNGAVFDKAYWDLKYFLTLLN